MTQPSLLDLFAGSGGMSLGFEQAGFRSSLAVDNSSDALKTFAENRRVSNVLVADLMEVGAEEVAEKAGSVDVVVGGPPCQGFSISGRRDPKDPRNILYQRFVDVVRYSKPTIFVMENVPNMASMGSGAILRAAVGEFEDLGYSVAAKVLVASDYGVPQNRRRLFVVGVRGRSEFTFPEPRLEMAHRVTTAGALSDLPEHGVDDGSPYLAAAQSHFQRIMRRGSKGIWNHQTTVHQEKTVSTIALVPDGGNYKDLPVDLQGTRRVNIAWTRYSSKKPSLTIDTGHRHHFHYQWNRIPTVRESARLQSFPDGFRFVGTKTSQYRQVGNAVPPLLARAVADSVMCTLERN